MFDYRYALTESMRFYFDLHQGKKNIIKKMVLPKLKGKVVFDFGCGNGHYTNWYAQHASEVTACDSSQFAIQIANSLYQKENLYFFQGTAIREADVTIFNDSLELNENWKGILSEVKSDTIFITCPNFDCHRLHILNYLSRGSKYKIKQKILEIEKEGTINYKAYYNRNFNNELQDNLHGNYEKVIFSLEGCGARNHCLYIIRR